MLIDPSYFIGDLNLPNSEDSQVQLINTFINKYEPEFLKKLFGYSFYKVFVNAIAVNPPDSRWIKLLYGVEYISISSQLTERWKGLIITDNPVYDLGNGYLYKQPYWIQADVAPGFVSGTNTATFTDWIGWTSVINRVGSIGVMQAGVDYTVDENGIWTLLVSGDKVQPLERFYISFELRPATAAPTDNSTKQSIIANYIYYHLLRDAQTQTTGNGEVYNKITNGDLASAEIKAARAWNEMSDWVFELYDFMQSSQSVYPEYDSNSLSYSFYYYFQKINHLF